MKIEDARHGMLVVLTDRNVRKVALVLAPTGRGPAGKIRIAVWSENSKSFCSPGYQDPAFAEPAPDDWKQTRHAREKALQQATKAQPVAVVAKISTVDKTAAQKLNARLSGFFFGRRP